MISSFYKNHFVKTIGISKAINIILPMAKIAIKSTTFNKKQGRLVKPIVKSKFNAMIT